MKKIVFFLAFLLLTRISVSFGAGPNPVGIENFFLGNSTISSANVNQVLGLPLDLLVFPALRGLQV